MISFIDVVHSEKESDFIYRCCSFREGNLFDCLFFEPIPDSLNTGHARTSTSLKIGNWDCMLS